MAISSFGIRDIKFSMFSKRSAWSLEAAVCSLMRVGRVCGISFSGELIAQRCTLKRIDSTDFHNIVFQIQQPFENLNENILR